ncbi:SIR2 family NAD-dependent protein deacylase, partial [Chitinimonas sp.]|uniref:SIR2 family NAD-dependent protein deacylase n=1 Tax=Chitinimonas sp. TaxID=1934313 RepID=UPI002F92012A
MGEQGLDEAVQWLREADGLIIAAGAGMGVDSGLPDFRGREGFWRAYPALAAAGLAFEEIADPSNFDADPTLAWGFYGHRLVLYRATRPHAGFAILQDFATRMAHGAAVYTSNVDGQFQRAGFDATRVYEIHGSIHHLQCHRGCGQPIWPADDFLPEIDTAHCRLLSPLPRCPGCGGLARPNILMFSDWSWQSARSDQQAEWLAAWLQRLQRP